MRKTIATAAAFVAASASAEPFEAPTAEGAAFFEPFSAGWDARWKVSKDVDFTGTWKHEAYASPEGLPGDLGLVVGDAARKHAVSTIFPAAVDPKTTGFVVQYELQLKETLLCGGAYLKLLTASEKLSHDGFVADTPYTVMFGPDRCGETNKVHFILRHKSPVTGEWEEKHLVTPPIPKIDKLTHLYTAIVGADESVKILVDNVEVKAASLLSDTDFAPPVNPPKEIDDPKDSKPLEWIDDPKMDDPAASKPDDWDEEAEPKVVDPKAAKAADWLDDAPEMVADPKAVVPDDWDAEEDGEWEAPLVTNPDCAKHGCGEWVAPMIANPEYKGKWHAPRIDNPEYVGVWSPAQIANPNHFVDEAPHAMAPIGGIGIELWTMQAGILFDNILVATDAAVAAAAAEATWAPRNAIEAAAATAAERADPPKETGFMGTVKYWGKKALYYSQDNAVAVGVGLAIGLITLIGLCWMACCRGGGDDVYEDEAPAPRARGARATRAGDAQSSSVTEDAPGSDDDDEPIKEVPKKEEKAKGGAKKRTPKAS